MKAPFAVLALLLTLPVQAEVYRIIGPDGSVTFTDEPVPGAERIELPPVMTYTPQPVKSAVEEDQAETAQALPYRRFAVASPADESTIRDNQGNISMRVELDPPLQTDFGHRLQFVVDGMDQGEPVTSPAVTFQNLDRGSHRLSARIIDASGATIETTPPVTVFLHRASVLFPGRQ